ncbi:MAG TPA: DUF4339 domain-containing protein, partial [Polyangiaceae bacterium]
MSDHSEIWHVRLPNGESREGTLEQLDEAFQAGAINESTLVRREGTSEWVTLAAAAGLEPAPAPVPMQSAPPPPVVSDLEDLDLGATALRSSKRGVFVGLAAAVAVFAAAGIFVVRNGSQEAAVVKAAGAAAEANLAVAATPVTPAPDLDSDGKSRTLTDDQKRALLDLDKAREAEAQKKRAKQAPRYSPPPMKTGSPFAK